MAENLSLKDTVTLRDKIKERIDPKTRKAVQSLNEESTGSPLVNANVQRWRELYKENHKPVTELDGFLLTEGNKLKTTSVRNIYFIFKNEPCLHDIFRFNEFTQEIDIVRDVELPLIEADDKKEIQKGQYTDSAMEAIELYIEMNPRYEVAFKLPLIDQAINQVARQNAYNPVKDYFKAARENWDGKHRIDHVFHTYLGADINETNAFISQLFFVAVTAKALKPKTKVDYVLDLVGGQGVGKTTLFKRIAPLGLYTDQFNSFTDKDDFAVMKNALIVNDDEMTASNAASFEEIKKFITMETMKYRPPYARKAIEFPKKFMLVRTTNEKHHLKDRSGDRRFLSIFCNASKPVKSPVTDLSDSLVKQLWGEAVWMYETEPNIFQLTKKQEKLLEKSRTEFRYTDVLEDTLDDLVRNKFKNARFIANQDLSLALFNDPNAMVYSNSKSRKVKYLMEHLGYDGGKQGRDSAGKHARGFRKSN